MAFTFSPSLQQSETIMTSFIASPPRLDENANISTQQNIYTKQGPSNDDWERLRPVIESLYIDESRTLEDVMRIMTDEHGHKGTVKMYKLRFTKWGLVKHNRQSDMAVIVRKKRARDAEGRKSTFLVHIKEVSAQDIDRYARRKRMSDTTFAEAPIDKATPTHIICLTPPDSPYPEPEDTSLVLAQQNNFSATGAATSTSLGKRRRARSPSPVTSNSLVAQRDYQRIRLWVQSPTVPCVVTTPDFLRRPEMLFADIRSYVQGSISNGTWYLNSIGLLESIQRGCVDASDFANLCYEATMYFRRSSAAQGRRLLSKAFSLLQPLLKEENPRLLQNLMDTLLRLKQLGYVDICAMIQNYIAELARTILCENPLWQRICISICYSDPGHTEVLMRSWRSLTDAFAHVPGVDGRPTDVGVMNEADLTYRLHRSTDPQRAEKLLRGLLAEYEQKIPKLDNTAIYLIDRLAAVLYAQERYVDVELLVEDALLQAREAGVISTARAADLMAWLAEAQYELLKDDSAEESLRNALELYAEIYGANDSMVVSCSRILERWLRDWGRDAEADQLSAEIDRMIGPDDIDLDAAVPPHYPAEMTTSQRPKHTFQRDESPQRVLNDLSDLIYSKITLIYREHQYHLQQQGQKNHTANEELQCEKQEACSWAPNHLSRGQQPCSRWNSFE